MADARPASDVRRRRSAHRGRPYADDKDRDHTAKPRDHHHTPATSAAGSAATSLGGNGGGLSAAAVGPPGFSFPATAATSSASAGVRPSSPNVRPPSPLTQQTSEPTAAGAMQATGSAEPVLPRPHSVSTQSPLAPLPPASAAASQQPQQPHQPHQSHQSHQAQQRHQEEVQRMLAAKRAAVQRARQMGATGHFKPYDSMFGNSLVPVIPFQQP